MFGRGISRDAFLSGGTFCFAPCERHLARKTSWPANDLLPHDVPANNVVCKRTASNDLFLTTAEPNHLRSQTRWCTPLTTSASYR
ncbi:uncharacterized [Tachysurus ichikawai]